jgi:hypothetical protein
VRRGGASKRRDLTEPAIIEALQAVGAFVQQCHGDGAPDLIVCHRGKWLPMECKSPKGKVRAKQVRYPIVRTPQEALALLGVRL